MVESFTDSKSVDIYPYSFGSRNLDFQIDKCKVVTESGSKNYVEDFSNSRKSLDLRDRDFERVEIEGTVYFKHDDLLERVVPREELDGGDVPAKLLVLSQCGYTFDRHIEETETLFEGVSAVSVNFSLDASEFYGKLDLVPVIARTRGGEELGDYAHRKSESLADGKGWTVRLDSFEGPSSSLIDSELKNFSELDELDVGEEDLFHLDLKKNPVLYINKDNPDIERVLKSGNKENASKARDVIMDMILQSVFTQLVQKAIWDLDGEHSYRYDWEEDAMDIFIDYLFPDSDMDKGEMLDEILRIREDLQSDSGTSDEYMTIMNNLELGIQRNEKIKSHAVDLSEVI
jgi:hypothetical protein